MAANWSLPIPAEYAGDTGDTLVTWLSPLHSMLVWVVITTHQHWHPVGWKRSGVPVYILETLFPRSNPEAVRAPDGRNPTAEMPDFGALRRKASATKMLQPPS